MIKAEHHGKRWRCRLLGPALLALSHTAGADCETTSLSTEALGAVQAADRAYAKAWLSNDEDAVLATLGADPVMPSGMARLPARHVHAGVRLRRDVV